MHPWGLPGLILLRTTWGIIDGENPYRLSWSPRRLKNVLHEYGTWLLWEVRYVCAGVAAVSSASFWHHSMEFTASMIMTRFKHISWSLGGHGQALAVWRGTTWKQWNGLQGQNFKLGKLRKSQILLNFGLKTYLTRVLDQVPSCWRISFFRGEFSIFSDHIVVVFYKSDHKFLLLNKFFLVCCSREPHKIAFEGTICLIWTQKFYSAWESKVSAISWPFWSI